MLTHVFRKFSIFGENVKKHSFYLKSQLNYLNTPYKWYQLVGNLIIFYMGTIMFLSNSTDENSNSIKMAAILDAIMDFKGVSGDFDQTSIF